MIPYPSSSHVPVLINESAAAATPLEVAGTVIGGVAIGALGIGSIAVLFQHLKRAPKLSDRKEEEKKDKEEVEVHMPDALTYLCINTADLEDVTFLLTIFKKRFHVIDAPVNVTDGPFR